MLFSCNRLQAPCIVERLRLFYPSNIKQRGDTMLNLSATFPSDLTGFCIFEIDTPSGHLRGSNFNGELSTYSGTFCPNLATITLAEFATAFIVHCDDTDTDGLAATGHITTNNGIAISLPDLIADAIATAHADERFSLPAP